MKKLPDCDDAFARFFDPWYSDDDRARRQFSATRPDLIQLPTTRGLTAEDMCLLTDEGRAKVRSQMSRMLQAAQDDWRRFLDVEPPVSLDWVRAFDEYYDRERVGELIAESDPTKFANEYVVITCEFGAVLGEVLRQLLPRLEWIEDWPYWESSLFDPISAHVLPPYHWSIKRMSEYGVEDGYAAKTLKAVEILTESQ